MTNVNEFLKNCVVVNNRTKKAFELIDNYEFARCRYGDRDLADCYDNYSIYKARAYKAICEECKKFGGYNMTIPTYNCNFLHRVI